MSPQGCASKPFIPTGRVAVIHPGLTARTGGELLSEGFKLNPVPGKTIVEYTSYRVGETLTWEELERAFRSEPARGEAPV